jgi:hypothetical protein
MRPLISTLCGAAFATTVAAGNAAATDRGGGPTSGAAPEATASVVRAPPSWPVLEGHELDALRGGDSVENTVDIHGDVTGNTADNITTGNNAVGGTAFGNAAGINTLIQNSGSNVLIQNGMTVNVQVAPPP